MKQQNIFEIIWEGLTMPFVAISILIDEDMRVNEDGYWNKRIERMNRRAARREKRAAKKAVISDSAFTHKVSEKDLFPTKKVAETAEA